MILTGHTCGNACWEAREDICRCSCGGKNHGCLRGQNGQPQPKRARKIDGEMYTLEAVGNYGEVIGLAIERNREAGCDYYPIAHGVRSFDKCVAKVRTANAGAIEKWPELASFRSPEARRTYPPQLLWIKGSNA